MDDFDINQNEAKTVADAIMPQAKKGLHVRNQLSLDTQFQMNKSITISRNYHYQGYY